MTGRELAALSGQDAILVIRRPLVRWLGTVPRALLLDQMLFDCAAAPGGEVTTTADEWRHRLYLTRRDFEDARDYLISHGLIAVEKRGMPARIFYRVDAEAVARTFSEWIAAAPVCTNEQTCLHAPPVCSNEQTSLSEPAALFVGSSKHSLSKVVKVRKGVKGADTSAADEPPLPPQAHTGTHARKGTPLTPRPRTTRKADSGRSAAPRPASLGLGTGSAGADPGTAPVTADRWGGVAAAFSAVWGITATRKAGGRLTAAAGKFVAEVGAAAHDDPAEGEMLARAFTAAVLSSGDIDRLPAQYAAERFARWHAASAPDIKAIRAREDAVARRMKMHPASSDAEVLASAAAAARPKETWTGVTEREKNLWRARFKVSRGGTLTAEEADALASEGITAASFAESGMPA